MQTLDEIRPAPRRTPSAVLWLMAAVVVGGSGLLAFAAGGPAPTRLAAATKPQTPKPATPTPTPAAGASPVRDPALSTLAVP